MSVVQNPLIGKARQSMGGATFSTWKGLNVLKTKPLNVANPNTINQQKQRNKMATLVAIYRQISAAILVGFRSLAVQMSEYNAFISDAIQNAVTADSSAVVTVDYAELLVAKGTIGTTAYNMSPPETAGGQIDVDWPAGNIPVGGALTDKVGVVLYNETQNSWNMNIGEQNRGYLASYVYTNPDLQSGDVVHVYVFFYNAQGQASDSLYTTGVAAP